MLGNVADEEMILNQFGNIELDKFAVMPNHVHGIIKIIDNVGEIHELPLQKINHADQKIERRRMLIPKVVGYFKMNSAKQINTIRNTTGIPVWQRNYYEHIIRNENKLNKIREYIQNNPLKWHLDRDNPRRTGNDLLEDEIFGNLKNDINDPVCKGNS